MSSELDSQSKGREFEHNPILDGNCVKTMPGSIPVPNPDPKKIIYCNFGNIDLTGLHQRGAAAEVAGDEAQERELARDGEDGRRQGQGAHHVERGQRRTVVADQVIVFLLTFRFIF